MRCFIAINLPEDIKVEIRRIQEKFPLFLGKKTELENLHLTLKFLGEINEEKIEIIKRRLKEIKFEKFNSEISGIGIFDNKSSGPYKRKIIVWLHLKNCDKLQEIIDNKLKNLFRPEKRFMGHLTIARIKEIENKKRFIEDLKNIELPSIKFNVKKFYLMKSELTEKGPKYDVLERYELK